MAAFFVRVRGPALSVSYYPFGGCESLPITMRYVDSLSLFYAACAGSNWTMCIRITLNKSG